jgi:hypothetical protein
VIVKPLPIQPVGPVGTTVYTAFSVPPVKFVKVSATTDVPEPAPPEIPAPYVADHVNVLTILLPEFTLF